MCTHKKVPQKRKRMCGKLDDTLEIDKEKLLSDIKTWPANKDVNWSHQGADLSQLIKHF